MRSPLLSTPAPMCAALLVLLVVMLVPIPFVSGSDLLQLVVFGTNLPDGALDAVASANAAPGLLKRLALEEGDMYEPLEAGRFPESSGNNGNGGGNGNGNGNDDGNEGRDLAADLGCPNACSKSGGDACRVLGCAFCGKCGRRRLHRQLLRDAETNLLYDRDLSSNNNNNKHRQIESELDADLVRYCEGNPDCSLKVKIFRVHDDGTTSRAT